MFMKKLIMAVCVLLTVFVMASCGDKVNTQSSAAEPDPGEHTEAGNENAAGQTSGSTGADEGNTNGGDFELTGQKWEWIYWDGDNDGETEEISFEYIDNGDEAESFVLVKLEVGGSSETYIDRARRIVRIFEKEDEEGPYLLVEYNYENRLTDEADSECIVRLRGGEIAVEPLAGNE